MVKRYARTEDLAAIRSIWSAAFPEDSATDRDRFLQTVRLSEECLVAEENGVPISMVCTLPVVCGAERLQYIYAAATLPSHRGRGVFAELLNTALAEAKQRGTAGSFLHPAEPSLAGYYARFGYRPWRGSRTETGAASSAGGTAVRLSPDEFVARREALLPSDSLQWEPRFVAYAASCGIALATEHGVAFGYARGTTLYVRELLGNADPATLCAAVGCTRYECRREGGDEPFMLYLPLNGQVAAPYVGLALD